MPAGRRCRNNSAPRYRRRCWICSPEAVAGIEPAECASAGALPLNLSGARAALDPFRPLREAGAPPLRPWRTPQRQGFVPGGPRKSVVSCGNGRCVVGRALLGAEWLLDGRLELGFGSGRGGGGGVLGGTVVGAIAGGAVDGALVTGGGIGSALIGGGGGVVVRGRVGKTTPMGPNGSRDTTVIADTTTPIATTPTTPTRTGPDQIVQDHRSR